MVPNEVYKQYHALEERLSIIATHCIDTKRFGRGRNIAYWYFGLLYPEEVHISAQVQFDTDYICLTVPVEEQGYLMCREGETYHIFRGERLYTVKRHLATGQYTCSCPDSAEQGNIWCKHRVAITALCPLLEGKHDG